MIRFISTVPALFASALALASCAAAQLESCTTLCGKKFWEEATLDSVRAEVERGSPVLAADQFGETPLHDAAYYSRDVLIIDYLLDQGADPNVKNVLGATPVFTAATSNPNAQVLQTLVNRGGDVRKSTKGNIRPIHLAAKANPNPEIILVLVEAGAALESKVDNGWTPLFFAVTESPNPEVARRLLDLGASVSARDHEVGTPLHAAAGGATLPEMVALLLDYGADVNAVDDLGSTPMHWVYVRGGVDEVLREHGYGIGSDDETDEERRVNMMAARSIVPMLIAAGADINVRNLSGETPLHWAVTYNANSELIGIMLDNGADPSIRDEEGRNASELLVEHHRNFMSSPINRRLLEAING